MFDILNCKLHHVAIQTADFDRAYRFYAELIGLPVIRAPYDFKNKRTMAWLDAGGALIELYSVKRDTVAEPYNAQRVGTDHISFVTPDMDVFLEKIKVNNIKVVKNPFTPPNDPNKPLVMFIRGPDGEEIEITSYGKDEDKNG